MENMLSSMMKKAVYSVFETASVMVRDSLRFAWIGCFLNLCLLRDWMIYHSYFEHMCAFCKLLFYCKTPQPLPTPDSHIFGTKFKCVNYLAESDSLSAESLRDFPAQFSTEIQSNY